WTVDDCCRGGIWSVRCGWIHCEIRRWIAVDPPAASAGGDFAGPGQNFGRVEGERPPGRNRGAGLSPAEELPISWLQAAASFRALRSARRFLTPRKLKQKRMIARSTNAPPPAMPASTQNCGGKSRMSESSA